MKILEMDNSIQVFYFLYSHLGNIKNNYKINISILYAKKTDYFNKIDNKYKKTKSKIKINKKIIYFMNNFYKSNFILNNF